MKSTADSSTKACKESARLRSDSVGELAQGYAWKWDSKQSSDFGRENNILGWYSNEPSGVAGVVGSPTDRTALWRVETSDSISLTGPATTNSESGIDAMSLLNTVLVGGATSEIDVISLLEAGLVEAGLVGGATTIMGAGESLVPALKLRAQNGIGISETGKSPLVTADTCEVKLKKWRWSKDFGLPETSIGMESPRAYKTAARSSK